MCCLHHALSAIIFVIIRTITRDHHYHHHQHHHYYQQQQQHYHLCLCYLQMQQSYTHHGIRFNCLCPAGTDTRLLSTIDGDQAYHIEELKTVLQQLDLLQWVSAVVLFFGIIFIISSSLVLIGLMFSHPLLANNRTNSYEIARFIFLYNHNIC